MNQIIKPNSIKRNWNHINSLILFLVLFLSIIGIGIGFVSGYHISLRYTGDPYSFVNKHILYFLYSCVLVFIFYFIPSKKIIYYSPHVFIISILFLILVFFSPLERKVSGANRWINLGFITFQPSEFSKIGFILFFSYFINKKKKKSENLFFGFLPLFFSLILPVFLISIEPDLSTAVIIFVTGFLMLFVASVPIVNIIFSLVLTFPFFIYFIQTKKYFLSRFLFLNPEIDPYGRGYHIRQSLFSFKNSGLLGFDKEKIIPSISQFPDTHTDFTFSVIARVGGFLGVTLVLLCYFIIIFTGLYLVKRIKNYTERIIVFGIISLFAMEFFFHILVTIGLVPTTGVLLPFLSYGGSAFISHFILIGILLRISAENEFPNN